MGLDLCNCTIHDYPHAFVNKKGEAVLIRFLDERRHRELVDMYLAYRPRNSFNGLPPTLDDACASWAEGMIRDAINLVALSFWDGLVGHAAIFPMNEEMCELFVVVAPAAQNMGVGTQLVRSLVQLSHELGFEKIWLSVEAMNLRARHVYKKCGFDCLTSEPSGQVEMGLDLARYRDATNASISEIMSRDVISIHVEERCSTAVEMFVEKHIGALPVVDDEGKLVGILSETDLIQPVNLRRKVSEILTREVVTADEGWTIERAIRVFQSRGLRCIPVVDRSMRLAGIIGRKDILAYYAKGLREAEAAREASGSASKIAHSNGTLQ